MLQTETENESHNESVLFKHVRSTMCTVILSIVYS